MGLESERQKKVSEIKESLKGSSWIIEPMESIGRNDRLFAGDILTRDPKGEMYLIGVQNKELEAHFRDITSLKESANRIAELHIKPLDKDITPVLLTEKGFSSQIEKFADTEGVKIIHSPKAGDKLFEQLFGDQPEK